MSIIIYILLSLVNTTAEVPAWILTALGYVALAEFLFWLVVGTFALGSAIVSIIRGKK